MRIVKLTKETTENILENMLKRSPTQYGTYEASVQEIIENVKTRKDAAVFEYTEKFDHAVLDASTVEVTQEEIDEAYNIVDPELIGVIRRSMKNIREFHEKQKQNSWFTSTENGTMLGQKLTALNAQLLYQVFLYPAQVGKLSFLPGIFNVNEPVIFGLPLVLNPMMAIPFFIVPLVTVGISFAAMFFGLVPYPTGVTVPWTMPAPFGGWMMCADIRGGILQLIVLVIGGLIYYPFISALDQQYLKEESAEAQTELKE